MRLRVNDKYGYVSIAGEVVIDFKYSSADPFSGGLAFDQGYSIVSIGNKKKFIDHNEKHGDTCYLWRYGFIDDVGYIRVLKNKEEFYIDFINNISYNWE